MISTLAVDKQERIGIALSSGLRSLCHLEAFLDLDRIVSPNHARLSSTKAVCVLAWGRKPSAQRALSYAKANSLPVWYLEDGWIRSCDETAHSRKCYSLLIDKKGVYYDSSVPSDLEALLNLPDSDFAQVCPEPAVDQARESRELIVEHEITKYNFCKQIASAHRAAVQDETLVLVIDQTLNDASVIYGGMSAQRFRQMLDAAIAENPGSRILVRTHPDVVSGKCSGYLLDYARERGVTLHAEPDNPIQWLKLASRVYVGTSQIGYEALICGCEVVVFGQPFYAGWGLTDDRSRFPARYRQRSVDQLFYACHVKFARYVDPVSGNACGLANCIEHVIEQKRQFSRNAVRFCCVAITPWKRKYLARYLRSPDGAVRFSLTGSCRSDERQLTWSYRDHNDHHLPDAARTEFRVEDGFIRSRGLGSDFVAPASLVVDGDALYFDRHGRSELERLLNTYDCSEHELERARRLRQLVVSSKVSKYNVASPVGELDLASDISSKRKIVLIVGQVEDDQSVARGCGTVNTNSLLIKAARRMCSDDYLLYKPHPDVESGNRRGAVDSQLLAECIDEVLIEQSIECCIAGCDELHTMTSLSGFEALLRGKSVVVHGMPFYAGWGLTIDQMSCEHRVRQRSLDELVYLALIAYPRYLHVPSGEFIRPETLVNILCHQPAMSSKSLRWFDKVGNIHRALRYAA